MKTKLSLTLFLPLGVTNIITRYTGTNESMMTAFYAWFLVIVILLYSIPYAFGSKETLARNSKEIGTQNLVGARIVSVIGVLAGCMLVLVALFFTYEWICKRNL
jgi:hypothetical protein